MSDAEKEIVCACGEVIRTKGPRTIRCKTCRSAYDTILRRTLYHVKIGKITAKERNKIIAEEYAAFLAKRIAERASGKEVAMKRTCPYCGRTHRSPESDYCATCRREGFSAIHQITGRTNGWDTRGVPTQTVVSGWRGRRVMGSGHHIGSNSGAW